MTLPARGPAAPPRSSAATLLLAGGLAAMLALTAVVFLPAPGAESTATRQERKSTPTPTSTASTSPSPTTGSPPATATTGPSSEPSSTSEPAPTIAPTTPAPMGNCGADSAVAFQGQSYCPGEIAGVEAGAYGLDSPVVLSVTVTDTSGDLVDIMGGPGCWVDPSWTEPVYCGDTLGTMTVDFTGTDHLPVPGTAIELYGVTQPGSITPDGFVTTSWCDPDYCS